MSSLFEHGGEKYDIEKRSQTSLKVLLEDEVSGANPVEITQRRSGTPDMENQRTSRRGEGLSEDRRCENYKQDNDQSLFLKSNHQELVTKRDRIFLQHILDKSMGVRIMSRRKESRACIQIIIENDLRIARKKQTRQTTITQFFDTQGIIATHIRTALRHGGTEGTEKQKISLWDSLQPNSYETPIISGKTTIVKNGNTIQLEKINRNLSTEKLNDVSARKNNGEKERLNKVEKRHVTINQRTNVNKGNRHSLKKPAGNCCEREKPMLNDTNNRKEIEHNKKTRISHQQNITHYFPAKRKLPELSIDGDGVKTDHRAKKTCEMNDQILNKAKEPSKEPLTRKNVAERNEEDIKQEWTTPIERIKETNKKKRKEPPNQREITNDARDKRICLDRNTRHIGRESLIKGKRTNRISSYFQKKCNTDSKNKKNPASHMSMIKKTQEQTITYQKTRPESHPHASKDTGQIKEMKQDPEREGETETQKQTTTLTASYAKQQRSSITSIYYSNVNHLLKRLDEIKYNLNQTHDVMAFVETWLDETTNSNEINIEGYTLYRQDSKDGVKARGVCVYVKNSLESMIRQDLSTPKLSNLIWLHIKGDYRTKSVVIGVLYRSLSVRGEWIEDLEITIEQVRMRTGLPILLIGDFNVDFLKNKDNEKTRLEQIGKQSLRLTQLVKNPTRITETTMTLIDHVYTSKDLKETTKVDVVPGLSDHNSIIVEIPLLRNRKNIAKRKNITCRSYKKFDKDAFNQELEIELKKADLAGTIHEKSENIAAIVTKMLNKHAPFKKLKNKQSRGWWTNEIGEMIRLRDIARTEHRKTKSQNMWDIYKKLRKQTQRMIEETKHKAFRRKCLETANNNPSKFWKVLPEFCPGLLKQKVSETEEWDEEKLAKINETFLEVPATARPNKEKPSQNLTGENQPRTDTKFSLKVITVDQIKTIVDSLDANKAFGHDGIPTRILKAAKCLLPYIKIIHT
jgi:hypothetical protein